MMRSKFLMMESNKRSSSQPTDSTSVRVVGSPNRGEMDGWPTMCEFNNKTQRDMVIWFTDPQHYAAFTRDSLDGWLMTR